MQLDDAQLAARAGTDAETVLRLRRLKILPGGDLDETLVPRVRFAVQLDHAGVSLEALAQAIAEGGLSVDFVDRSFLRPVGMLDTTYRGLAEQLGVSERFAEAVQIALGLPAVSDDPWVREDDAEAMHALAELVSLGVDEAVLVRLFQIMAHNLREMARAASEMWSAGVQQPLLEGGLSNRELLEAQSANGAQFQLLGERITQLLWNRFLEEEIFRGTIETLEMVLQEAGAVPAKDDQPPAIAFLDLTAFTHLTDREGDEVAAADARDLVDVVRRTSVVWGGTLVKMLGDGAMLHFREASAAVHCCLALADDITGAGLPPARFGVNAGSVIVRDVDFYGQTVNVAARLMDYARPGEVLVTGDVVAAVRDEELAFSEIGSVSLKGVASLVEVYSARTLTATP